MAVFEKVKKEELEILKNKGFQEEKIKSAYEILRLRKGKVVLVLFSSGKLLLQGDPEEKEEIAEQLRKEGFEGVKSAEFRKETGTIIGTDESLKGDTFGGLVVAGVKADSGMREKLKELGVKDSKRLADKEILVMAEEIKKLAECEIRNVFPEEYSKSKDRNKITVLLNKLHKECYDYLKPGKHVVDKYPGCSVGDIAEEKAEDKYVEVAAASVLARAAALAQMKALSAKAGFELPRGSTHVKPALLELKKRKLDFKEFVKLDFGNVKEFL